MFIYLMKNEINDKVYVGQARNLRKRELAHRRGKCGCTALQNSINKHGQFNFSFSVIDRCFSQKEMDEKEKYWIKILSSRTPLGYNIKEGGEGGGPCAEETKIKIGMAHKGRKRTPEQIEYMRQVNLGRKTSEETKEKLRRINLGKKMSPAAIEKMRQFWLGRKHAEKSKQKMSESSKGHQVSTKIRDKIRQSMLGRTYSEETLLKMSRSAQERVKRGILRETCKHGHKMSKENTYVPPGKANQRQCRSCLRINSAAARLRKKAL